VLFSINEAIRVYRDGAFPTREMFLFVVAALASPVAFHGLLRAASLRYNEEITAQTLRIVEKLRRIDLAAFEEFGGPSVLARLTTDADRVLRDSAVFVEVLKSAGLVVLALVYFMSRSVEAAIFGFGALAILTALTSRKNRTLFRGLGRAEAAKAEMLATGEGVLRGLKQVKVHAGRREGLMTDMAAHAARFRAEREATFERYFAEDALGFAFFFSLQAYVVFISPLVFTTTADVTHDLLMTIWYISGAMGMVFKNHPELADASTALGRIHALEARLDAAAPAPAAEEGDLTDPATISVRGLRYRYRDRGHGPQDQGFQVGPVDVTIRRSELVFVTGNNGSGKSTFLKLLTGLYRPDAGEILCDDRALPPAVPQGYRDLFAVILGDFVLFERLYGMEDADPLRVRRTTPSWPAPASSSSARP
jgi:putative pyoverdin transport system ATP-binding/permease protein